MAKKKSALRIGMAQGAAVAEELKKYHRIGRELRTATKSEPRVSTFTREKLCKQYGISKDKFYKTLAFANRYTVAQLNELCGLRNAESHEPLHWAHVRLLLGFPADKLAVRNELQAQAVDESWTVKRLRDEVQKVQGGKKKKGPRHQYKDLVRWLHETQQAVAGLFELDDPKSESDMLVVERVVGSRGRMELSRLALGVSEDFRRLSEAAARRRTKRPARKR